jgi:plasmid maintenance system antidote protein VapI
LTRRESTETVDQRYANHGKAALTPEMALRIEKAFGPDMNHLLRMRLAYGVAKTRQRDNSIKRYVPEGKGRRAASASP